MPSAVRQLLRLRRHMGILAGNSEWPVSETFTLNRLFPGLALCAWLIAFPRAASSDQTESSTTFPPLNPVLCKSWRSPPEPRCSHRLCRQQPGAWGRITVGKPRTVNARPVWCLVGGEAARVPRARVLGAPGPGTVRGQTQAKRHLSVLLSVLSFLCPCIPESCHTRRRTSWPA